jgi:hypothetical protein
MYNYSLFSSQYNAHMHDPARQCAVLASTWLATIGRSCYHAAHTAVHAERQLSLTTNYIACGPLISQRNGYRSHSIRNMTNSGIALQNLNYQSERSISHRSKVSTEIDISSSSIRASEEADLAAWPTPANVRKTLLSPEPRQSPCLSPSLSRCSLAVDDSDAVSDRDDDSSLGPARGNTYFEVCSWWIPELFASLLSVVTLGCIIAVLRTYNGSLLTELDLPRYLTLNGVVAALATVNRACLNTPVCSALLQQMWLYLATESKVKGSPRSRLRDLELYTDASTGAWGSLVFLCKARMSR